MCINFWSIKRHDVTSGFGSSRRLSFTRKKRRVAFENCTTFCDSLIYMHNHLPVTAIKREIKCILGLPSLVCKACRKYSGHNVDVAARVCVGLHAR